MKDACHFHFPVLRKLSVPPSPPLPLKDSFRFFSFSEGSPYSASHDPQFLVPSCALYILQNDIHTDSSVNGTQELCSIQPNPMALAVPKSRQATPRISPRLLIEWVGSTIVLLLSSNTTVKMPKNETPKRIWVFAFQITLNMHSSPTEVPILLFGVPLKLAQVPRALLV